MRKFKDCQNCRHGKTTFEHSIEKQDLSKFVLLGENPESVLGKFYGTCLAGNVKSYEEWWKNNGHLLESEPHDEMSCFEATDLSKSMDSMLDLLNQMSDLIDKERENEKIN